MQKKWNSFRELSLAAADVLKDKLQRADGTVIWYKYLWRKLGKYMANNGILYFDSTVGKTYLLEQFGDVDYAELRKTDKDVVKVVSVLCEFYNTGTIMTTKERTVFDGPIGDLMKKYFCYLTSKRMKKHTVDDHEQHLHRFLRFLDENKVTSVMSINQLHLLNFIKGLDPRFSSLVHGGLRSIRCFLKYLYEEKLVEENLSLLVPRDNYISQPKLPSTYSSNEIENMIASIDRANAHGKRNYALVMLAARLGLRVSDIRNLKFENLLWEECKIVLNQYKTGNPIELPLLADVGDAIIDYLKYGRPKSNEPFVFLIARYPFTLISASVITVVVQKAFLLAGVDIENRKHGPHALRHSLAGLLLEQGTALPVITEVLGHENTESTRYYLRIDLKSMRQCILDVPAVAGSFYNQKGGCFYE